MDVPNSNPGLLKLRVSAAAESALRAGHPWLFADSIREQSRLGQSGNLAVIYDRENKFLALGLFDAASPLRVRVLVKGRPEPLNHAWWAGRLDAALERRRGLFDGQTTGYRWINGESDGWPALVLDRYDETLVLKLYSEAWLPRLDDIRLLLRAGLAPARIVLRLSRNIQDAAQELGFRDGQIIDGPPLETPVIFLENGLQFEADVLRGQKTGFFLDQRDNRRRVGELAGGAEVLNAFSYSGGFSLCAARGGARAVLDLDISPHALESARRNFVLNRHLPLVRECAHTVAQAEAFAWLAANRDRRFDLIVLDPPSFARREAERAGALRAYAKLVAQNIPLLRPRGVLVAASCSAHVPAADFFSAAREAAQLSRRSFTELDTTAQPADHPATFPEGHYLKCIYLRC